MPVEIAHTLTAGQGYINKNNKYIRYKTRVNAIVCSSNTVFQNIREDVHTNNTKTIADFRRRRIKDNVYTNCITGRNNKRLLLK